MYCSRDLSNCVGYVVPGICLIVWDVLFQGSGLIVWDVLFQGTSRDLLQGFVECIDVDSIEQPDLDIQNMGEETGGYLTQCGKYKYKI
jgi:hypothetical protein